MGTLRVLLFRVGMLDTVHRYSYSLSRAAKEYDQPLGAHLTHG